eukprot:TRINITY_DN3011_c0_g3_i2.p1 TRINITY_DN3011_c0_g3~~TRINITY_DN3011_c0_g3_i2.p1  ORF type:complete len:409 (-),score=80.23 TRINITY_DN3011_c0_g3_i2:142-1368(-)
MLTMRPTMHTKARVRSTFLSRARALWQTGISARKIMKGTSIAMIISAQLFSVSVEFITVSSIEMVRRIERMLPTMRSLVQYSGSCNSLFIFGILLSAFNTRVKMGFLSISSFAAIVSSTIVIITCWFVATSDKSSNIKAITGCIEAFHEARSIYKHSGKSCFSPDLNSFYGTHKDAFVICRVLSIVCGFFWILTGISAFIKPKVCLILGIISNILFVCSFTTVVSRTRYNEQCELYREMASCMYGEEGYETAGRAFDKDEAVAMKGMYKSYELLWGSSIVSFITGAYQIACAIVLVYREQMFQAELVRIPGRESEASLQLQSISMRAERMVESVPQTESELPMTADDDEEEEQSEGTDKEEEPEEKKEEEPEEKNVKKLADYNLDQEPIDRARIPGFAERNQEKKKQC